MLDLGGPVTADGLVEVTLGGEGGFRGAMAHGGRLTLTVPPRERDALLVEALNSGWSVLAVGTGR